MMMSLLRRFLVANQGHVAMTFGLLLVPILGAGGAAIDYSQAVSARTAIQTGLDATALNLMKSASTMNAAQLSAAATSAFNANFHNASASNVAVNAAYDSATQVLTLTGSGSVATSFSSVFGISQLNVNTTSKATIGGNAKWPVCVLVTDPNNNHTLKTANAATIDFSNCMVQVNTQNWDAVEARDTSYIHSVNGKNCFTGDIHYGDVTPPKEATCTMMTDPYLGYTLPSSASTCNYTNLKVTVAGTVLNPGTYCNNLQIQANVTFNPGLYIIKNGKLAVTKATSIQATGVTFLLTGNNAAIDIDMSSSASSTLTMTPATTATAGSYAGFLFFLDQTTTNYANQSFLTGVNLTSQGVIYLTGQQLIIEKNSNITLDTGSIVAGYILPDASKIKLVGTVNSPDAASAAMQKTLASTVPILVK